MKTTVLAVLVLGVALPAAEKAPPSGSAENAKLAIGATLLAGKEAVRGEVGSDLDGNFLLVRVKLTPKSGKLGVVRDDFLLRNTGDGQKCRPYHPSQIAGRDALVVSSKGGGAVMAEDPRPLRIPRLGGPPVIVDRSPGTIGNAEAVGNTGAAAGTATATAQSGTDSPVLTVLKEKVLPEKEIEEPLSGLLYFSLEGKPKTKNLELVYEGSAGKLTLRFR